MQVQLFLPLAELEASKKKLDARRTCTRLAVGLEPVAVFLIASPASSSLERGTSTSAVTCIDSPGRCHQRVVGTLCLPTSPQVLSRVPLLRLSLPKVAAAQAHFLLAQPPLRCALRPLVPSHPLSALARQRSGVGTRGHVAFVERRTSPACRPARSQSTFCACCADSCAFAASSLLLQRRTLALSRYQGRRATAPFARLWKGLRICSRSAPQEVRVLATTTTTTTTTCSSSSRVC